MSLFHGLQRYYNNFGVRGVLAAAAGRVFGCPREITAHPPGILYPVQVRARTTDVDVYGQVLLDYEYSFDLPFSPETIIDVGANIGMASIYFLHRYPKAKIIAIEPEPSNFAVLARNIRPYPSIVPVHAALWSRDGEISISSPEPNGGTKGKDGFVTHDGPGTRVRAITLQTLMREMRINSIDLLKVDIEGAEKEVFEACDWMRVVRCLMIELHDRLKPGCSQAVNSVTQGFSQAKRHETVCYFRET
jgi:FkbM family methyltransferase